MTDKTYEEACADIEEADALRWEKLATDAAFLLPAKARLEHAHSRSFEARKRIEAAMSRADKALNFLEERSAPK
ncbi:MAG: hypothetical protein LCH88_10400 [Proteobacteria bacterium]|nr:hypothetical protein [Pseudomonadota bacterium]